MEIKLYNLENGIKLLLSIFLIVLTIGVSVGLVYLKFTTKMNSKGTIERYNGSKETESEFELQENYAKSISEMLITTHSHVIIFAIIFLIIGIIFYFSSVINGFWKIFLITEPLISTLVTFTSIWGLRFINELFVYLTPKKLK